MEISYPNLFGPEWKNDCPLNLRTVCATLGQEELHSRICIMSFTSLQRDFSPLYSAGFFFYSATLEGFFSSILDLHWISVLMVLKMFFGKSETNLCVVLDQQWYSPWCSPMDGSDFQKSFPKKCGWPQLIHDLTRVLITFSTQGQACLDIFFP